MKTKISIIVAALLLCGLNLTAQTNLTSVPDLLGISGDNLKHVANDATRALKGFDFKNASAGVFVVKVPSGYGIGIDVHTVNTNNPVQLGFALFGAQERNSVTGKNGYAFYDASLSIGLSTTEKLPILGWPVRLMIETGPAFKFSGEGGGVLLEQSAAYADLDFRVGGHFTATVGAGVIHCSDSHFNGKAMPMVHANLNWSY